jgi:hypothetical protein
MCGKIRRRVKRKKHHYSAIQNKNSKCYWYSVKMQNGLIVDVPETYIQHINDAIQEHNERSGTCPYNPKQIDSWVELNRWQGERVKYLLE